MCVDESKLHSSMPNPGVRLAIDLKKLIGFRQSLNSNEAQIYWPEDGPIYFQSQNYKVFNL